jgi:DNA-binding NarL/FixJ family response regulator
VAKIRILLADDHAVLRAGLRALIHSQPGMEVVAEAADGLEAIRDAGETLPDLALLDLSMPGMSGIAAIDQVRKASPGTRVLVLTVHDDAAYARAALDAGAAGYVTKDMEGPELLAAIRAVARGRTFVAHALAADPSGDGAAGERAAARLSERERQVLELVARGHTNREVAQRLALSIKTVETYRARLSDKLGLRTRAELVRFAAETGLLVLTRNPPPPADL